MKVKRKSFKSLPTAWLVVLLISGFGGQAFGNKKPKFVYVVNLGSNNISGYAIDNATGVFESGSRVAFRGRCWTYLGGGGPLGQVRICGE